MDIRYLASQLNDDLRRELNEYIGISELDKYRKSMVIHQINTMRMNSHFYCHLDDTSGSKPRDDKNRLEIFETRLPHYTFKVISIYQYPDFYYTDRDYIININRFSLLIECRIEPLIIIRKQKLYLIDI